MKLPFTIDQFLEVFRDYNLAVFPMQVVFYLVAALAIFFSLKKNSWSDRFIAALLSFLWLWMGVVYHLIYFTAINKAAYAFGTLYLGQATIFLFFGVYRRTLSFKFGRDIYGITGGLLILYALAIYPVIGYLLGHAYPESPTFGLPCPTTIFTFGLLLWTDRKFPRGILVIPFLWSIVGFMAAFSLGIREDIGLMVSGVVATGLLLMRNRK